ncbi:MAG: ankyrin repeat domain-containing protein [Simkaniaceae bacterium]|nr:ankyrin repeat domain-containing protein [Simkaniaceae bacterium]
MTITSNTNPSRPVIESPITRSTSDELTERVSSAGVTVIPTVVIPTEAPGEGRRTFGASVCFSLSEILGRIRNCVTGTFILPNGTRIRNSDAIITLENAASNGQLEVIQHLLSNRKIRPDDLRLALAPAASTGQLEVLHYLLDGDRAIHSDYLGDAIIGAAENGQLDAIRFILFTGRTINDHRLGRALCGAVDNDKLEAFDVFLSLGDRISPYYLGSALKVAAKKGNQEIVEKLLASGRIKPDDLGVAVKFATQKNKLEIVNILLSHECPIRPDDLGSALLHAVRTGKDDIISVLLSSGRPFSDHLLGHTIIEAAKNGKLDVINYAFSNGFPNGLNVALAITEAVEHKQWDAISCLLSDGRDIMHTSLIKERILSASARGHADVVEFFIRRYPIDRDLQYSAISRASGPEAGRIRDMLEMARIEERTREIDPRLVGQRLLIGTLFCTFDDVKANPLSYLETILEKGFPTRIHLIDTPQAIDLGGVTKQFITTLVEALVTEKTFSIMDIKIPLVLREKTTDKGRLTNLGQLYSLLHARNKGRSDYFIIGALFNPKFFEMLLAVKASDDTDTKEKAIVILLDSINSEKFGSLKTIILDPSDAHREEYAAIEMCENPLCQRSCRI